MHKILSERNRFPVILSALILCGTISLSIIAPTLLSPFFTGPDGVRWLTPFLIWMGCVAAAYCLIPLTSPDISCLSERYQAGAVIVFFSSIILFVIIQRFSSGLRYIETFNEIMAIRLARGASLYPDPEIGPVGTLYTPLFFLVTAPFHLLFPPGFAYGRLISGASFFTTAFFVYRIVKLRNGSDVCGLWAAALFLATYKIMNSIYDQSCVDTLQMCLSCITLFFFLKNTEQDDMIALFVGGCACCTKQPAIYPFLLVLGTVLFSRRRLIVYLPVIFWGLVGALLIVFTKGWAISYLAAYPARHGFRMFPPSFILHCFVVLQFPLWLGVVVGLFQKRDNRFHAYLLSVLLASFFGIYKSGGGIHPLFPTEPLLCIAAVTFVYRSKLLLIAQLFLGIFNPFSALYPWETIRQIDKKIVSLANGAPDDVWLPMETYLYSRTNKMEWDNFCALFGPTWAGNPPPQRLLQALENKRFSLILIRKNSTDLARLFHPAIKDLIKQGYEEKVVGELVIYKRKNES